MTKARKNFWQRGTAFPEFAIAVGEREFYVSSAKTWDRTKKQLGAQKLNQLRLAGTVLGLPYFRDDLHEGERLVSWLGKRGRQNPSYAHWTSDPEYAYDQFYRNPRRGRQNPSAFEAEARPWAVATNAGPFVPEMFPYGVQGRPFEYVAKANPRHRWVAARPNPAGSLEAKTFRRKKSARRWAGPKGFVREYHGSGPAGGYALEERDALPSGVFLKPESRMWPVGDRRHAEIALQYMTAGRGRPLEYPQLIWRLAEVYPVEDERNRAIWTMYRSNFEAIRRWSRRVPSPAELRRRAV